MQNRTTNHGRRVPLRPMPIETAAGPSRPRAWSIRLPDPTMHILHLIDPEAEDVGPVVCRLLCSAIDGHSDRAVQDEGARIEHTVLLFGGTAADRIAASAGLDTPDRIHSIGGKPWMSVTAFRRYLRRAGAFHMIQAWSPATLALTAVATSQTRRGVYLSCNPTSRRAARWMRFLAEGGNDRRPRNETNRRAGPLLLAISNSVKRQWVQDGGIPPDRVHVVRPGLDFGLIQHANRAVYRRRWGISDDRICLIGVCGHPARSVDARRAARLLVLASLDGSKAAMVLPPGCRHLHAAHRMLNSVDHPLRLIVDEAVRMPWNVFPACDAALVLGDDTQDPVESDERRLPFESTVSGPLPMLWAAAAGATIVGEASYAVSEIIEHGHSGLLIRPGDENGLFKRVVQAATDRQSTWRIRDAARSEAFSFFSKSRFATDLATVHQQFTSGDAISVPELPTTGGLRFAGRA